MGQERHPFERSPIPAAFTYAIAASRRLASFLVRRPPPLRTFTLCHPPPLLPFSLFPRLLSECSNCILSINIPLNYSVARRDAVTFSISS